MTMELVGGGIWWFTKRFGFDLGGLVKNVFKPAECICVPKNKMLATSTDR